MAAAVGILTFSFNDDASVVVLILVTRDPEYTARVPEKTRNARQKNTKKACQGLACSARGELRPTNALIPSFKKSSKK